MAKKSTYTLDREMALAVRRVVHEHIASFQPRPHDGRKRRVPDNPFDEDLSNFAYVTVAATADGGSIGKAVRLNWDMTPIDIGGDTLVVDPASAEYDAERVEEVEIEFKSSDFVDAAVGKRVLLHWHQDIEPGLDWEDQKVRGTLVEYQPAELTCTTIEVVTDVECVADEIVYNTANITYVNGPCP